MIFIKTLQHLWNQKILLTLLQVMVYKRYNPPFLVLSATQRTLHQLDETSHNRSVTLFLICFWCSILFLDRRPKHCHWDFALIVILKIASSLLTLAVRKTWRSLTWFGYICSVFNSLCILYSSCDKTRYLKCSIKLPSLRQTPLYNNYDPFSGEES